MFLLKTTVQRDSYCSIDNQNDIATTAGLHFCWCARFTTFRHLVWSTSNTRCCRVEGCCAFKARSNLHPTTAALILTLLKKNLPRFRCATLNHQSAPSRQLGIIAIQCGRKWLWQVGCKKKKKKKTASVCSYVKFMSVVLFTTSKCSAVTWCALEITTAAGTCFQ